jgi:HK97 family phage major capsid protein
MSERLKALREKRGVAVKTMRDIIEAAEKRPEGQRDLTTEELTNHGKAFDEVEKLRKQIEVEERTVDAERESAKRDDQEERSKKKHTDPKDDTPEKRRMKAFRTYLRTGRIEGTGAAELAALQPSSEDRALQAGSDVEGGFLRPPPEFIASLLQGVDNATFIRQRATKHQLVQPESLGVPTLDTDIGDFDWTTELQTGSLDETMRFGKRELRPHPMAKRVKISKKLLRASALPIEQIVMSRMAYKLGITQEKAYLTGDGMQKPLGLFTASADGIPTSRDISTGNTATAITFDGLIEAKYGVKAQYWPKSDWLFHRDAVKNIVKLKDGDGQYIWRMSVKDGEPDMLLGRPMMISEYAPNTFTSGLYVGLFGDFSYYWIVDSLDLQVQRLVELYAETNQDGFIARYEGDGAPVLAEAFARVKLG